MFVYVLVLVSLWSGGEFLHFPAQPDIALEHFGVYSHRAVFFSPHENESVVNGYLIEKVLLNGGQFLVLRQAGERHITLSFREDAVVVDPNRIFSQAGVRASLLGLNSDLDPSSPLFYAAQSRAIALGRFILARFPTTCSLVVAVHNNTDGYDDDGKNGEGTISILRYQTKQAAGARYLAEVNVGPGDEDDLFFATNLHDFKQMKDQWSAVLQSPDVATLPDEDDGSLSVWAEMKHLRYINVEAQRKNDKGLGADHLEVQSEMIDFVFELPGVLTSTEEAKAFTRQE